MAWVITRELRRAIAQAVAEEGLGEAPDPGLRPGQAPGRYASSAAFSLPDPQKAAARISIRLADTEDWIETAEVTGRGYITVTVTAQALQNVADTVAEAGDDCVRSDALAGRTCPNTAPPNTAPGSWEHAATWDEARQLLTAELTTRLARAAGARVDRPPKARLPKARPPKARTGDEAESGQEGDIPIRSGEKPPAPAAAVAFAGRDAVLFSLARAMPNSAVSIDGWKIARHHPGNPAYAVRYAHARAASGVRWAAAANPVQASPQRPSADPGEQALLDALSWLPERVATAARRGRPDEFARYLERLADVTLAALTRPPGGKAPGSDRLALARAAQTGTAAGLKLLGVNAPERL